jgi:ribose transport system ATP-binding protein/rhamnose transport system ATP-binding protein
VTLRLKVTDLSKSFPGVRALDSVSIDVGVGEVHALLGENGAGKSTLGKIIGGVYSKDSGTVALDGAAVDITDEAQAGKRGIAIVHQEGSLVRQLSIADNIYAGRASVKFLGMVDTDKMVAQSRALLAQLGSDLDPRRKVSELSSAQMQVVEIAKALSQDLKLLILDEPTAALTLTETDKLFDVIRRLKANGVSVIYVSHRLAEIFQICDRVSVLKDGRLSGVREVGQTTTDELIRLMVGRDVHFSREQTARRMGERILSVRNLAAAPFVRDVSLDVHAGEIVCLAGLVGSGRSEACETIFAARQKLGGSVELLGQRTDFSGPWDAMKAGIGMVPEDRKEAGLFLGMDIARNLSATVLERLSPRGIFDTAASVDLANRFIKELRIATPSALRPVGDLSGGNQQKVLLAKWLAMEPRLLIVDEPTRGVDVGARSEIYRLIRDLASKGMGLLIVSSDLLEVLTLADRIIVMADGRTVGELPGKTASEEAVLKLATHYTHISDQSISGAAA